MSLQQYKYITFILVFLLSFQIGFSQDEEVKPPKYFLINMAYSFQVPGGDLADRYGSNNTIGLGLEYLTPNNILFGLNGDFLFGTKVKEDVLVNLRNSDGSIIGNNRGLANIKLTERGINVNLLLGKIWNISKKQPKSGIRTTIGVGILQHKIRIQQDPSSKVPQAEGEYARGYDRLSNGLSVTEFIGYQLISNNKRLNFIAGIELTQAFTKNRRDFNFDTMMKDDDNRFDTLLGFKVGFTLPFQVGGSTEEIYYVPGN